MRSYFEFHSELAYNVLVRMKVFLCAAGMVLLWAGNVSASLDPEVRDHYADFVQKMCFSVGNYALDRPLDDAELEWRQAANDADLERTDQQISAAGFLSSEKSNFKNRKKLLTQQKQSLTSYAQDKMVAEEYHARINCILNDAYAVAVQEINAEVLQAYDRYDAERELPLEDFEAKTQGCFSGAAGGGDSYLQMVQRQQEKLRQKNGLQKTACDTGGEFPTVETPFSACRVGETVMAEFCGYRAYLTAKKLDDQTLIETSSDGKIGYGQASGSRARIEEIDAELQKAEQALFESLDRYRRFEQRYRLHAYLVAIRETLTTANKKLSDFREAFNLFPDKFINASSETCKQ